MLKHHLNKLEYFCAIIESQSLLKASRKVYISQPQLSKIIRQLEEEIGSPLLIRNSSGVQPTPNGLKLYQFARETIDKAAETELLMNDHSKVTGVVNVGTYDSIARYFFPDFIKYLKKSLPSLDIELTTGRSKAVLEKLSEGQLQVVVALKGGKKPASLIYKTVYTDSFGLYCAKNINTGFQNNLIAFPEIIQNFSKVKNQLGFQYVHSCDNLETVKSLVEQGMGVGLLPHRVAREGIIEGKFHAYKKDNYELNPHEIILAHNKNHTSETIQILLAEIERFLKTWSNS